MKCLLSIAILAACASTCSAANVMFQVNQIDADQDGVVTLAEQLAEQSLSTWATRIGPTTAEAPLPPFDPIFGIPPAMWAPMWQAMYEATARLN